jgi:hypothetical protein
LVGSGHEERRWSLVVRQKTSLPAWRAEIRVRTAELLGEQVNWYFKEALGPTIKDERRTTRFS